MATHIEGTPQFHVFLCPMGTSPFIQSSIWNAQHFCVTDQPEEYMQNMEQWEVYGNCGMSEEECGKAIIKHQLNVEHYSVLNFAYLKFNCYGFPHSTVQQVTRHRDSAFLVTSMRYTGDKFCRVAKGEVPVQHAFYVRPEGVYSDRSGRKIEWTDENRYDEYVACRLAAIKYYANIGHGMPYEMAREFLPFCYRQPFTMSCTVEQFFHFLDQRTKKDSEREIQILAKLCLDEFIDKAPQLGKWYKENRYGKARLAP